MRKVADRLFIGKQGDDPPDDTFATVRAAKHPWHFEKCGKVTPDNPYYFSYREGATIALNIIDPPTPLFKMQVFQDFLEFAADAWKRGKKLLITCNKGESRAPSLALVFMAKALGILACDSYDNAWDDYEEITGCAYTPGKGIETWLRANWSKIPECLVPAIMGAAAPGAGEPDPVAVRSEERRASFADLTEAEAVALVKESPFLHFSGFSRIKDKDGKLTAMDETIEPNVFQSRLFEAYEWCVANEVPIRIVAGPKPRQSGGSTGTAELCLHHSQKYKLAGMMLADENDRTDLIWDMFNEMVQNDRVRHIWGTRHEWNSEYATFYYKDEEGVERSFNWLRDTANDPKAGASGTRQVLWFSEAGRYSKEGKVTDQQVISNASSSVPEKPLTMIILESTAEGASGYFYSTVKGAVTLEERMQGKVGNGWIKVSCWWHECPDYVLPRTPINEPWFGPALDEREKRGVMLYNWTAEQIAWRRNKIAKFFEGNEGLFDQEFPESQDVAFQSSGNPRFHLEGLTKIEAQARVRHNFAQWCVLEGAKKSGPVQLVKNVEAPWLWLMEPPMYHARYILFADCMTGEQSAGSLSRDSHAVGVWRAPYVGPDGQPHGAKLVAALGSPRMVRPDGTIDYKAGVRWEDDLLAHRAHLLSRYYGNCIMAVEINQALGVVRELINLGANLWKRTKQDEASGIAGKTIKIPGWQTTSGSGGTRAILVAEMAKNVREQSIEVEFLPMAHELKQFVTYENGSCAARNGEHDDWVMGPSIGLVCMPTATEFRPPPQILPTSHREGRDTLGKGIGAIG